MPALCGCLLPRTVCVPTTVNLSATLGIISTARLILTDISFSTMTALAIIPMLTFLAGHCFNHRAILGSWLGLLGFRYAYSIRYFVLIYRTISILTFMCPHIGLGLAPFVLLLIIFGILEDDVCYLSDYHHSLSFRSPYEQYPSSFFSYLMCSRQNLFFLRLAHSLHRTISCPISYGSVADLLLTSS